VIKRASSKTVLAGDISMQSNTTQWWQGKHWFVLGMLLTALIYSPPGIAQSPPPARMKVGLVDLGVVFNKFKKKLVLEQNVRLLKKKYDLELKKQNKLVRQLDKDGDELEGLKLQELEDRIKLERERRRIMKERFERTLQKKLVDMALTLLDEINKDIEKYGKKYGYTVILKVDNQGIGPGQYREKIFRAQVQSILYYDGAIDITQPILKLLNAKK
jgi:Skp family chaperone for outer membrane proteins